MARRKISRLALLFRQTLTLLLGGRDFECGGIEFHSFTLHRPLPVQPQSLF